MRIKRLLLQVDNEPNIGELPNVGNGYHIARHQQPQLLAALSPLLLG